MAKERKCQFKFMSITPPEFIKCNQSSVGKSKFCIFHKADKKKKEAELFREGIREKLKKRNYNFKGFVFPEAIDFKKDFGITAFEREVDFSEAQFKEGVGFVGVRFIKGAKFVHATFQVIASFWKTQFQESANFWRAQFQGIADFTSAQFQGIANFNSVEFLPGKAEMLPKLKASRFLKFFSLDLSSNIITITGEGWPKELPSEIQRAFGFPISSNINQANPFYLFIEASFLEGSASFTGAQFQGDVGFGRAEFQGSADFSGADFRERGYILPRFIKKAVLFKDANLQNISLAPLNLDKDAWIDFTDARLRETKIRREDIEDHISQEEHKNFSEAKEIYLLLKNNFHSLGRYDDESWAFRKEKEMERKSFWHFRKEYKGRELGEKWDNKGIKICFYSALLDYEYTAKYLQNYWFPTSWKKINRLFSYTTDFFQHPIKKTKDELKNFVCFMASNRQKKIVNLSRSELSKGLRFYIKYPINYFCSTFLKYLYGWGERPHFILGWCLALLFFSSIIYYLSKGVTQVIGDKFIPIKSYWSSLYFSIVTFTTLGYGDFRPVGLAKIVAGIEASLGIFLVALFVFSFARRTGGR